MEDVLPPDSHYSDGQVRDRTRTIGVHRYAPVALLFAISIAAALSIAVGYGGAVGMSLHAFMGFSLSSIALLRLLDLSRFADAFSRFDLLARRWRGYGYVYPFLELGLGLAYFSYVAPVQVYFATAILSALNMLSVISSSGRRAGAFPCTRASLTAVTAMESAVMFVMAMVLLWL